MKSLKNLTMEGSLIIQKKIKNGTLSPFWLKKVFNKFLYYDIITFQSFYIKEFFKIHVHTQKKKKKFQNCWYISGCPNITHEKKYVQLTCKRFTSLFHDQLNATSFHIPIFPLASREKTKRKDTMSYCIFWIVKILKNTMKMNS